MRYFAELAYKGTRFLGWQRQDSGATVQGTLEDQCALILGHEVAVTGCGRTDTGVHAEKYLAHFDLEQPPPKGFLQRINKVLPPDIAIRGIWAMPPEAHARYDAISRSYTYYLAFQKDPFRTDTAWYFPYPVKPEGELLQQAADLLLGYDEFYPFCKSNSGLKHMRCQLQQARWQGSIEEGGFTFQITANRFLRGMVRLIVAMCVNVATGRLELDTVRKAMDEQKRLKRAESAPAQGLFLTDVAYPYPIKKSVPAG